MTATDGLAPDLWRRLRRAVRTARPLAETLAGGEAPGFELWHGLLRRRCLAGRAATAAEAACSGPLAALLAALPSAVFTANDALGWAWQFWNEADTRGAKAAGGRIGPAQLAAATCLFTEPYMVRFLLHNTLGAWHAARLPAVTAADEATPRSASAVAAIEWTMLRLRQDRNGAWRPAAGGYPGWPARAAEIALLDPCCGGGHFLVAALPILAALRMAQEKLDTAAAVRAVLRDNLFGLDLDGRSVRVARDAVMLAAQRLAGVADLPAPRIHRIDAPLGSLAEPDEAATDREGAALLARRYTLLATNVPFLGWRRLPAALADHVARRFPTAKADLATVMLQRMRSLAAPGGSVAAVTPQNWLFLSSYRALRRELLGNVRFNLLAPLGEHGFASAGAAGAFAALVVFTKAPPEPGACFAALDAHAEATPEDKAALLQSAPLRLVSQAEQLALPDGRVSVEPVAALPPLSARAGSFVGFQNGDAPRWVRRFWELPGLDGRWSLLHRPVDVTAPYGGRDSVLFWEGGHGALAASDGVFVKGREAWGRPGVLVRQFRHLPCTLYTGELFDQSGTVLCPADPADLPALWAFCASGEFAAAVRRIDRKLNVTNGTLGKVGFDLAHWRAMAAPLPEPASDEPTQWLFHGHPAYAAPGTELHVALARVAGYRWPAETGVPMRLSAAAGSLLERTARLPQGTAAALLPLAFLAERLRAMLAAAFGAAWSEALLADLVRAADRRFERRARDDDLMAWLGERAFRQHVALFQQRPFLWQIGQRGGWRAFLNYHRLSGPALREIVRTVPSGPADRLRAILDGAPPCDIFVRWKPPAAQPRGWDPDPDDGVRQNIRPFVAAGVLTLDLHRILRACDRGAGGARRNDRHAAATEACGI